MLDTFGYPYTIELATRPEKAMGSEEHWDRGHRQSSDACSRNAASRHDRRGGGAFYGPKLDFKLIDAIGRRWQGPTVQLDFNLPERFGMGVHRVGQRAPPPRDAPPCPRRLDGAFHRRAHRALCRRLPALAFAPEQVRILPISEAFTDSAETLVRDLRSRGIRASLEARDSLNYRIREAEMRKVPYMGVIGEREVEDGTIAVRRRGGGRKQEVMDRGVFTERLVEEIRSRSLD
jgi:threonyl-tRNA synthetase